jgi:hypothetical protein
MFGGTPRREIDQRRPKNTGESLPHLTFDVEIEARRVRSSTCSQSSSGAARLSSDQLFRVCDIDVNALDCAAPP